MAIVDEIESRLRAAFDPHVLEVIDESDQHIGHAGNPGGGESHFQVTIAAADFVDKSRIERHRAVHNALGADLVGRIHALALNISA